MNNLFWYALAGSRGGETRVRVLLALKSRPMNANQLATALKLDYKTVQHHIRVLEEHQMISALNKGKYGAVYVVSEYFLSVWGDFGDIWERFGKSYLNE